MSKYLSLPRFFVLLVCLMLGVVHIANAQMAETAYFRLVHFAGDAETVDAYLDGEVIAEDLGPGSAIDFISVSPGAHTLAIAAAGGDPDEPVFAPTELDLAVDHRYSAAIIGQAADDSLNALVLDETALITDVDMSQNVFRILIHNLPGVPLLSFYENDTWVESNIPFGGYSAQAFTPFVWDTGKAVAGDNLDDIVFDFDSEVDQSAGYWEPYTVYLYGAYGTYPGAMFEDYSIDGASHYVVAPDIASFLAAFTPYNLTSDFKDYFVFETMLAAMEATDFVASLPDEPVTIFVPTDQAFAALPADALDALMADSDALRDVLLYHVVPGSLTYDDIIAAETLTTLQGDTLAVTPSDDDGWTFRLNDDTVVVNFDYPLINMNGTRLYFVTGMPLLPN